MRFEFEVPTATPGEAIRVIEQRHDRGRLFIIMRVKKNDISCICELEKIGELLFGEGPRKVEGIPDDPSIKRMIFERILGGGT